MAPGTRAKVPDSRGAELIELFDPKRKAPAFDTVPRHIAIVMDGNGRWANARGLTRTEGHKAGEAALLDVIAGAIEAGVTHVTAYAFSTENWKRSPEEVRFLMGYNKEVLRRRRDLLNSWGVKIRWAGRVPKLWPSVIEELKSAEKLTQKNKGLVLTMAVNYGGRQEILDSVNQLTLEVAAGKLKAGSITAKKLEAKFYVPELPDVDLFLRSSGEQRTSNFLLWQSSYAEMLFMEQSWPDFARETLWEAISEFSRRSRRFGEAKDTPLN